MSTPDIVERLAAEAKRRREWMLTSGLDDSKLARAFQDVQNAKAVVFDDAIAEILRLRASRDAVVEEAAKVALAESMKAPLSTDHEWDRGYRAGAASCWSKIGALKEAKP